jgi:hypothetical protein
LSAHQSTQIHNPTARRNNSVKTRKTASPKKSKTAATAQAKALADKPHAIPRWPLCTSRSSAGTLSPEPGTYGSGSACTATGHISVIDDPPSTRTGRVTRCTLP